MSEHAKELTLETGDQMGVLSKEFALRLLNCSSSGCLLETTSRIENGTIGTLRLTLEGAELTEDIQVVRCQKLAGAGSLYHVGAKFLWTQRPAPNSLRQAMRRRVLAAADRPKQKSSI